MLSSSSLRFWVIPLDSLAQRLGKPGPPPPGTAPHLSVGEWEKPDLGSGCGVPCLSGCDRCWHCRLPLGVPRRQPRVLAGQEAGGLRGSGETHKSGPVRVLPWHHADLLTPSCDIIMCDLHFCKNEMPSFKRGRPRREVCIQPITGFP